MSNVISQGVILSERKENKMKQRLVIATLIFILLYTVTAWSNEKLYGNEVFPESQVEDIREEVYKKSTVKDKKDNQATGMVSLFSIRREKTVGRYPTRKGVILVTSDPYKGLIPTGHAAIVYNNGHVIESVAKGVIMGPNNWNISKKKCIGVSVKGTSVAQDSKAADWCYKQMGKGYNFNYLNVSTRAKFYCSQLVWASFKDNYNIDLNTKDFGAAVHPLELANNNKVNVIYKK
jgi:uncharacterized distant relative of cell wall-associated hydrolases